MKKIKQFNEERDWDKFHSPENLAKSISIEAGELLECFQWNSENYNLFMLGCDSHGSGGLLYSAEKVEDRQCAIDDYMDEYLDHKNIGERDYQI